MSAQTGSQVDLAKLFSTVTRTLKENQQSLNEADPYNHNHGDNMVTNFQTITKAMRDAKDCSPSEQLSRASEALGQQSQSGSAQLYSQGLAQAAEQMRGQSLVTPENAMLLVQALMGGQTAQQSQAAQAPSSGMDLLGSLLGGQPGGSAAGEGNAMDLLGSLLGGQTAEQPMQGGQAAGGDLLGGLLGAFMGGTPADQANQPQSGQGGIDLNTLLAAGMTFFQARQQGQATAQALAQAVMAGSQTMGAAHHTQSGQLVAETLINTLGTMLSGRK